MTNDTAYLDVRTDGELEEFVPEAAAYFANGDPNESVKVSEDGHTVTVTGTDALNRDVELTYRLSQVIVALAEYDDPGDATVTTEPANVEREPAFGGEDADPSRLTLDGGFNPDESVSELWERADIAEFEEDYVCATGLDDDNPVPQQYDAYWILTNAEFADEENGSFYTHDDVSA